MYLTIDGASIFASTGGRDFTPQNPTLLFIHGSGQSHLSWVLQARFFANRGWACLAPDLPAHGLSKGDALTSIEDCADFCAELLAVAQVKKAIVIGHSQGGLVALELAKRHPDCVKKIALIATALAIPVAQGLLDLAEHDEPAAIKAMVSWGHGTIGHRHHHTMPGQTHLFYGEQVMHHNPKGVLLTDLNACNSYKGGRVAASAITCPSLAILAEADRMTPIKYGLKMVEALTDCTHHSIANAGHFVQSEWPQETNRLLRPFFEKPI